MARGTKKKILDAAFILFAENGYAGTNIQSIADSVGIVKSALYRHFKSKVDIWDEICDNMSEYYSENFNRISNLPNIPEDVEELYDITMKMVDFSMHDHNVITMRKIITIEQFRNEKASYLASKFFIYDFQGMYTIFFREMMKNGKIIKADSEFLSFSFVTPIQSLINLCDREPEKVDESIIMLQRFASDFLKKISAKNNKCEQESSMTTFCGADCGNCKFKDKCKGCEMTCGKPFGGTCVAAEYIKAGGKEAYLEFKKQLVKEINELLKFNNIPTIDKLYELSGGFVNLEYPLPSKESVKFLDDKKIYLGSQIEFADAGVCYGVVADTTFILICSYSVGGSEPEIVMYKKR